MQAVQHPFSLKQAYQVASHTMFEREQRCGGCVCPSDRFRDLFSAVVVAATRTRCTLREADAGQHAGGILRAAEPTGQSRRCYGRRLREASDAFKAFESIAASARVESAAFRASVRLAWLSALLTVAIFSGVGSVLFSSSVAYSWRGLSV